ncbi:MAG: hypothetical protein ACI83O_000692 [Patescibacteria group bacterium]|jgi:hypothetical protein
MKNGAGWKGMSVSLKLLFCFFIFWSIMTLPRMMFPFLGGYPLFGLILYGYLGVVLGLLFNFVFQVVFLVSLWNRSSWGLQFGLCYIGLYILNSLIALVLFAARWDYVCAGYECDFLDCDLG